jgi:hypothetical protein
MRHHERRKCAPWKCCNHLLVVLTNREIEMHSYLGHLTVTLYNMGLPMYDSKRALRRYSQELYIVMMDADSV